MNSNSKIKSKRSSVNKEIACDGFSGFFNHREGFLENYQYFWENDGLRVELQLAENRNDVQRMSIEIITTKATKASTQQCLDIFWSLISDSTADITKACVDYIDDSIPIDKSLCPTGWKLNCNADKRAAIQLVVMRIRQ